MMTDIHDRRSSSSRKFVTSDFQEVCEAGSWTGSPMLLVRHYLHSRTSRPQGACTSFLVFHSRHLVLIAYELHMCWIMMVF